MSDTYTAGLVELGLASRLAFRLDVLRHLLLNERVRIEATHHTAVLQRVLFKSGYLPLFPVRDEARRSTNVSDEESGVEVVGAGELTEERGWHSVSRRSSTIDLNHY